MAGNPSAQNLDESCKLVEGDNFDFYSCNHITLRHGVGKGIPETHLYTQSVFGYGVRPVLSYPLETPFPLFEVAVYPVRCQVDQEKKGTTDPFDSTMKSASPDSDEDPYNVRHSELKESAKFGGRQCKIFSKHIFPHLDKLKDTSSIGWEELIFYPLFAGKVRSDEDEQPTLRVLIAGLEDFYEKYHGFRYTFLGATSFSVFVDHGDPLRNQIHGRLPVFNPQSEYAISQMMAWLSDCCQRHEICSFSRRESPLRLIHVTKNKGIEASTQAKLVDAHKEHQYAVLSYCWGIEPFLTTTKANLSSFLTTIPIGNLPPTIQDAFEVTLKLNLEYIWIDCLCIVQDDPLEMAMEIPQMTDIYTGSNVAIIAASAVSVYDGFLHRRVSPETYKLKCRTSSAQGSLFLSPAQYHNPLKEPLNHRAWALQELLLPPRLLFFGSSEIFWSCCECAHITGHQPSKFQDATGVSREITPQLLHESKQTANWGREQWTSIVSAYTKRSMTRPLDKLPAIAGIAQRFGALLADEYLAGLWRKTLLLDLLWLPKEPAISSSLYKAPSWSWASVDGEVSWFEPHEESAEYPVPTAHVLDVSIDLTVRSSPYGEVKGGTLEISGRVLRTKARVPPRISERKPHVRLETNEVVVQAYLDCVPLERGHERVLSISLLEIIPIADDQPMAGLVLLEDTNGNTYRRAGFFWMFLDDGREDIQSHLERFTVETVKII